MTHRSLLAAVVWMIAACGGDPVEPSAVPSPPAFPDAPAVVQRRVALPFCGEETVVNDQGRSDEGRQCLWNAYLTRRPAEFVSHMRTIEGDPVTYIFRVGADGRVEIFVDHTQDAWSAGRWLRLGCPGLTKVDDGLGSLWFVGGLEGQADGACIETPLPSN
jgi:hypothetical protein